MKPFEVILHIKDAVEEVLPQATFMHCDAYDCHQLYDSAYPHVHLLPINTPSNVDVINGIITYNIRLFVFERDDHSNDLELRNQIIQDCYSKLEQIINYIDEIPIQVSSYTVSQERLVRMGVVSGAGASMNILTKKIC
jgi:hypothetical protein